jgi:hypothetical protein
VSFVLATFISMKFNNRAVRVFYTCAAAWTGFVIYFFGAAFLYGLLCMVPVISVGTSSWIGFSLIAVALVTGIYGIFHSSHITVKQVAVTLPNMPAVWKNRTAIWISDIHLGHVRGVAFARKITEKIISLRPDIVFIGGDLYDGSKVDAAAIIEPLRQLVAVTAAGQAAVPLGVYFIMGNHEEFHPADTLRYAGAIRNVGVTILDDEMIELDGLRIIGVDHGRTEDRARFTAILGKIIKEKTSQPTILLKHEPRHNDVAAVAGISLQISGHTHRGQIFPVNLLTWLIFKGFDYGLKPFRGNTMQIYTSSGVGTWGPPLRVGTSSEIVVFRFL